MPAALPLLGSLRDHQSGITCVRCRTATVVKVNRGNGRQQVTVPAVDLCKIDHLRHPAEALAGTDPAPRYRMAALAAALPSSTGMICNRPWAKESGLDRLTTRLIPLHRCRDIQSMLPSRCLL